MNFHSVAAQMGNLFMSTVYSMLGYPQSITPEAILRRKPPEACSLDEMEDLNRAKRIALQYMLDNKPTADAILDLSDVYLAGVDFSGIDLSGVMLIKANLIGANLEGTILDGADLSGAILIEANLRNAKLKKAILDGANLYKAILKEANLTEAKLKFAELDGKDLSSVNLTKAKLTWAKLRKADLRNAILDGTRLGVTEMEGANLDGAILSDLNMKGIWDVRKMNLAGAILKNSVLSPGINLQGVKIEDSIALSPDNKTVGGVSILQIPSFWEIDWLKRYFGDINNPYSGSLLMTIDSIDCDTTKVRLVIELIQSLGDTDISTVAFPLLVILGKSPYIDDPTIAKWLDKVRLAYTIAYTLVSKLEILRKKPPKGCCLDEIENLNREKRIALQ